MTIADPTRSRHILAIEPYYGGSHQAFIDAVIKHSRHDWTLVTGAPRHWKWRMRHAPMSLAIQACKSLRTRPPVDLIFASEMLDLPAWRGFAMMKSDNASGKLTTASWWAKPAVVYFHENQWTYPLAPHAKPDAHFGYTNLLTALAADEVWFNSRYHQDEFITASKKFVQRMPDSRDDHDFDALLEKSRVVYPGVGLVKIDANFKSTAAPSSLQIGWVSRWENDKRPDRFAKLLDSLAAKAVDFELILLGGARQGVPHPALAEIRKRFGKSIRFDGYATTGADFEWWLQQMDVVVSTADHEFFGIAVCEAVSAGALPIVPNRLSYPEWFPTDCLYEDLDDAVRLIEEAISPEVREDKSMRCQLAIKRFEIETVVAGIDDQIHVLSERSTKRR